MKAKLTLISFLIGGRPLITFVNLPLVDDRPVLSYNVLNTLHIREYGFPITIGQTISTI